MEFVILGRTALYVDGEQVPLGVAKQRALLAVLLYHLGAPVRIDTLVEHLWSARGTPQALYPLVSRIRGVLAEVGLDNALTRIPGSGAYRLAVEPESVDFHRFGRLVARAREASARRRHDTAVALLGEAVALWRDEPLADLRGARAEALRTRIAEERLGAQKLLAESQLRGGLPERAFALLDPLVREHPVDETIARHWIEALCALDRDDEARAFLATFRRRYRQRMRLEPTVDLPPATVRGRNPAPVPRQLPKSIFDFAGRKELLVELDEADTNLIVLSGMPGVGKTTLAVHWAHLRRGRFPDGQIFVNANAFGAGPPVEPHAALRRFLTALGVPADRVPRDTDERRELFDDLVVDRAVLVVVDNARDSTQVRQLLSNSASCVTLVTSRNRLSGLTIRDGARCLTVPPLPEPECRTLLGSVIGARRASSEPAGVAELARLSGGLPLVLRIIGERVAERDRASVADLAGELNDRLLSVTDEDEEASLQSVLAWSYTALTSAAARMFRLVGLLPGLSIGAEAAAALAAVEVGEAELLLGTLARAHLITRDTGRRYRFHDLLQRYAAERAAAEEPPADRAAALGRLLTWYLLTAANASRVLAPQQSPVPDLPVPGPVVPLRFDSSAAGSEEEALRWCESERATIAVLCRFAASAGFPRHGWQLAGTTFQVFNRGRQDEFLELARVAVSAARLDNHAEGLIGTLLTQGAALFALLEDEAAARSFHEAVALARRVGDADAEAAGLHNIASFHIRTGDFAAAANVYTAGLAVCRRTGNVVGESAALHRLGMACRRLGRHAEAAAHLRQALAVRERVGDLRGQGATHHELALLFLDAGDPGRAREHCERARVIATRIHDDLVRCDASTTAADIARALSGADAAVRSAEAALSLAERLDDPIRLSRALVALAGALAAAGLTGRAGPVRAQAWRSIERLPATDAAPLRTRLTDVGVGPAGEYRGN
ncbi:AfsR/SARP family transcriptional regulator [Virgisporangium aliadipatigenens]|uniref:AfsR/SARP family transcriptional regulator n=1 Tax=Virgisporangium aliadipatigenens TaxID=741659 RepID=UPI0019456E91|nr:tetratricopeptide repeat protein [Virgisporangium aliadipatigenens]